jgi:phosphoribosylformylglycinamidine synthase I
MQPLCLIIRTAGTNCDAELAHAFELAGAAIETIHLNRLIAEPQLVEQAQLIGLPGGFSYGDDIAAGRILANRLRHHLLDGLQAAIQRGVPIIGICNGFQVLVKLGLLPDPQAAVQTTTLADNIAGRFIDQWVGLDIDPDTCCIWTHGLERLELPIAHGEGCFVPQSEQVLGQLQERHQVVVRYAEQGRWAGNPNGSVDRIAGICDPTGLVLGLMPHPERYTHRTHHPIWTRASDEQHDAVPAGLRLFQNAVRHVKAELVEAVNA